MSLVKKNVAAISAAVVGFGLVASHANAGTFDNIPFDGTTAPWSTIPVAATAAGGQAAPDLVQLKIANNSSYIYFQLTFDTATDPTSNGGTYIGIDSDNNPNTGYNVYGSNLIGTNAAYQNDYPFSQAKDTSGNEVFNSGGSFSDSGLSSAPGYFTPGESTTTEEIAIPIDDYETDTSSGGYNGPVFQTSTNSFTVEFYTGSSVLGPVLYTIAGPPVQSTYALTGSGDFNAASSWSNGVPGGVGAEADFTNSITANHTVYSDVSITLSKIVFNSSFTYVLAGAGDLTLSASGTSASVDAQAGTQKITLPITIATNTIFSAESGATLVIGGPVTVDSGATLTQSGAGTVQYISTITVNSGGSVALAATSHAASLSLVGASTASLIAETGTKTALQLDALTMSTGSTFDLKNGDVIVHNGNASSIQSSIAAGFAGGTFTGAGIVSSSAAASSTHLTTIGVLSNGASGGPLYSTFDGVAVNAGDVLLKYTYYGDTNLDGKVDATDYSRIDSGFITHATGWFNGDFNYDGVINGSDYTLIDNAFNTQTGQIGVSPSAQSTAEIAGASAGSGELSRAVPEPTMLSVMLIGSLGVLGRRRSSV